MGFFRNLFGGGAQQPVVIPPPPAPPAANPPSIADPSAVAAGVQTKRGARAAAGAGFDGTLLTGGQGAMAPATAGGAKSLTGE